MQRYTLSLALVFCLLATGCSTSSKPQSAAVDFTDIQYVPGELNGETLYDLLTAELAGYEKDYALSLERYLKQARLTGDIGVIRRALRIAHFTGNQQAGESLAKLWLEKDPDATEPYAQLAGLLIHQKRFNDALPYLKTALRTPQPQLPLMIAQQAGVMPAPQRRHYLKLISEQAHTTPEKAYLWLSKGLIERADGQYSSAVKSLEKAALRASDPTEIGVQQVDLYKEMERYNDALALANQLLDKDPEHRQLHLLKVQTLFKAGKSKQALTHSRQLLKANPDEFPLHLYLALLALDFNQLEFSRDTLTKAMAARNTTETAPYFYLGLIEEQENNPEKAINYYQQVKDGNNRTPAIARMVKLFTQPQNADRVNNLLVNAIAQSPDLAPEIIVLHAEWLREIVDNQAAAARLDQGLKAYPDNLQLKYTRAMLRPSDEFPQAEAEFRQIIAKEPNHAMALNALGYTMALYTDRYEEAHALLNKALAIKPDDPAIIDSMGWVLFKLQRLQEAEQHLQKAFSLYPDPEVGSHLIQVWIAQGKHKQARALLAKLQAKHPDNPNVIEAADILEATP